MEGADEKVAVRLGRRRKTGGPVTAGHAGVKGALGGGRDCVALGVLALDRDLCPRSNRLGDLEREFLDGDEGLLSRMGTHARGRPGEVSCPRRRVGLVLA